jgi:zinc transporter, ZIP family
MPDLFATLALALLPALGNFIGSAIAESTRAPQWVVGAALHGAAGIAIAVVSVDLMPRILDVMPIWLLVGAFFGGAMFSVVIARGVEYGRQTLLAGTGSRGAWMVYVAIAADVFSDGLMTGAGSAVSGSLGLLLALSQVVGNVPGGFAAVANFRDEGVGRPMRLVIAGSFVMPALIGAGLGDLLLRGAGPELQNGALAFVVGVLLLATVEDTVPQGDEPGTPRWISTAAFALGFAFFAVLSTSIG